MARPRSTEKADDSFAHAKVHSKTSVSFMCNCNSPITLADMQDRHQLVFTRPVVCISMQSSICMYIHAAQYKDVHTDNITPAHHLERFAAAKANF